MGEGKAAALSQEWESGKREEGMGCNRNEGGTFTKKRKRTGKGRERRERMRQGGRAGQAKNKGTPSLQALHLPSRGIPAPSHYMEKEGSYRMSAVDGTLCWLLSTA